MVIRLHRFIVGIQPESGAVVVYISRPLRELSQRFILLRRAKLDKQVVVGFYDIDLRNCLMPENKAGITIGPNPFFSSATYKHLPIARTSKFDLLLFRLGFLSS